tara:strand:- start:188 stop:973 length:786 start_codon:yes stop_codon:yes gene_type:complete
MKNFWTRFFSGMLYALLIAISVFYSKFSFKVLITFFSIIVLKEYFNLINLKNYFFLILVLFFVWTPKNLLINNYLIIATCVASLISSLYCTGLLFFKRSFKFSKINFYVSLFQITSSFFFMVQIHEHGNAFSPLYLFLFFSSTWINNIFAYLIGSKFGKNKILQEISPNKTWEGFFGGFFASSAFIYFMEHNFNLFDVYWIVLGIMIPIVSLIGDLLQSFYKRRAKIKDSGNLIPGHGGVYDRMDSVIYSSIYYYLFLKVI